MRALEAGETVMAPLPRFKTDSLGYRRKAGEEMVRGRVVKRSDGGLLDQLGRCMVFVTFYPGLVWARPSELVRGL